MAQENGSYYTRVCTTGRHADQGAGEPVEQEHDGANEADGGGEPEVQLVIHVGPLEAVDVPAHEGGDVDDVQHCHVESGVSVVPRGLLYFLSSRTIGEPRWFLRRYIIVY